MTQRPKIKYKRNFGVKSTKKYARRSNSKTLIAAEVINQHYRRHFPEGHDFKDLFLMPGEVPESGEFAAYKYKSALDFAMAVINNEVTDADGNKEVIPVELRLRMAAALLPYQTVKPAEMAKIGRKDQKVEDAKDAASGDFAPASEPLQLEAA